MADGFRTCITSFTLTIFSRSECQVYIITDLQLLLSRYKSEPEKPIVDSKQISSSEPENDAASYHRNVSYAIAYTR
jgi:hypothetical protein